jgi:DNA polymerase IV (DinB-like DNA polymerase)
MASPPRIIAHLDMDAFFASIEALDHPEWSGQPIIVCVFSGRTEESGVVSSASYDARSLGVKAGMPISLAKQKCPSGHFVSVHHERYSSLSDAIFSKLWSVGSSVEVASIDEAYVDLTSRVNGSWEKAEQSMREFQSLVKKEFSLSCSVGIGPNKLVAKIASDFQKPSGFTVVLPESVSSFLDPLPVKKLLGVGPKTEEILSSHSILTVSDLRIAGLNDLVSWFGGAKGQYLFFSSRGMDESPIESNRERKQHSKIWTLKQDAASFDMNALEVSPNADELWEETVEKGQYFTQIGVLGISSRMNQSSKSKTLLLPCASREQFGKELEELFPQLFDSGDLPLRRIGIRVSGFSSAPKQKRLFDFG